MSTQTTIDAAIDRTIASRIENKKSIQRLDARRVHLCEQIEELSLSTEQFLADVSRELEDSEAESGERKLHQKLSDVASAFKKRLGKLKATCVGGNVEAELNALERRFNRTSIDVGAAGGTQAGKSFTLCNMMGLENKGVKTFFPIGGKQESTTGANGRIKHTDGEPHACVEYFTWQMFRDKLLKPLIDYFRSEDVASYLKNHFGVEVPPLPITISKFRGYRLPAMPAFNDRSPKGCSSVWRRLQNWLDHIDDYAGNFGKDPYIISVDDAYKYSAYLDAIEVDAGARDTNAGDMKLICPSVRLVTGEIFFHNPVARKCVFWDLPGKNELGAPDVTSRYEEAFNLEKDIVFYVKRYNPQETLQEDTLGDLGQFVDKLPSKVKLCDFVPVFFNIKSTEDDFDLEKKLRFVRKALSRRYAKDEDAVVGIKDGNGFDFYKVANRDDQLEVEKLSNYGFTHRGPVFIFGDAANIDFVQNELLTSICEFASVRTEIIDKDCIASANVMVADAERELTEAKTEARKALAKVVMSIPGARDGDNYTDWADKLIAKFFQIGHDVFGIDGDAAKDREIVPQSEFFVPLYKDIKKALDSGESGLFVKRNAKELEEYVKLVLDHRGQGLVEDLLIQIRRGVLKSFSPVQSRYDDFIAQKILAFFQAIKGVSDGLPFLEWEEGKPRDALRAWISLLESARCGTMKAAAEDLYNLRLDYYIAIYPELRKRVYSFSIGEILRDNFEKFIDDHNLLKEVRVKGVMDELKGMALEWLEEIFTVFNTSAKNESIIQFAFERFIDETCNSPASQNDPDRGSSESEMRRFCQKFWEDFNRAGAGNESGLCKAVKEFEEALSED